MYLWLRLRLLLFPLYNDRRSRLFHIHCMHMPYSDILLPIFLYSLCGDGSGTLPSVCSKSVNQFDPARRKKLQYYSGQLLANRIREYSEVVLRLFCFRPDRIEILLSGKINQNRILQLSPIIQSPCSFVSAFWHVRLQYAIMWGFYVPYKDIRPTCSMSLPVVFLLLSYTVLRRFVPELYGCKTNLCSMCIRDIQRCSYKLSVFISSMKQNQHIYANLQLKNLLLLLILQYMGTLSHCKGLISLKAIKKRKL